MKSLKWLAAGGVVVVVLIVVGLLLGKHAMRQAMYPTPRGMPEVVASSMDELLVRLETALRMHAPESLDALRPGLSADEIARLEKDNGVQLDAEMRALYQWRNGAPRDSQEYLIPIHRLVPLDEAFELRSLMAGQVEQMSGVERALHNTLLGHQRTWLVVLDDGSGDGYFFDPQRTPAEGALFYHSIEMSHYIFFPSLKNLLAGIIECYETGVYSVDADGHLTADYEKAEAVWGKYGAPRGMGN